MIKQPVVFGVGGLLEQGESGRIQDMLHIMKDKGCIVYAPRFRSICRDGNTILCPVNGNWVEDISAAVNEALLDDRVDKSRIGLIGSSLGATFIDRYLINNDVQGKITYAALVPFTRANVAARPYVQKMIDGGVDMDVSFSHDRENGRRRVIPARCLQEVLDINIPEEFRNSGKRYDHINALTILGLKDDRVDNEASKIRHKILSGKDKDLLELEYGHVIPQDKIQDRVLEFMYDGLGIN